MEKFDIAFFVILIQFPRYVQTTMVPTVGRNEDFIYMYADEKLCFMGNENRKLIL